MSDTQTGSISTPTLEGHPSESIPEQTSPPTIATDEFTTDGVIDIDESTYDPGNRQARLYLSRVDPWAVMKTSFVLSLGLAIVVVVATMVLWLLLSMSGVFGTINSTINDVGTNGGGIADYLSFGRVLGFAMLLAAFEIVLVSAFSTVVAAIYNITAGFTGGIEMTLSED